MTDAPERIWLQDAGDYGAASMLEVRWSVEPIDDADTEYVRADIAAARISALEADLARARERVEALERAALKPAP